MSARGHDHHYCGVAAAFSLICSSVSSAAELKCSSAELQCISPPCWQLAEALPAFSAFLPIHIIHIMPGAARKLISWFQILGQLIHSTDTDLIHGHFYIGHSLFSFNMYERKYIKWSLNTLVSLKWHQFWCLVPALCLQPYLQDQVIWIWHGQDQGRTGSQWADVSGVWCELWCMWQTFISVSLGALFYIPNTTK